MPEVTPDYIRGLMAAEKAIQRALGSAEAALGAEEEVPSSFGPKGVPIPTPDGWNRFRVTYQYGFGQTFRKRERYHDAWGLLGALAVEFPDATYVHASIRRGEYLDAVLEVGDVEYKAVRVTVAGEKGLG